MRRVEFFVAVELFKFQIQLVRIFREIPETYTLVTELEAFRVKATVSANETFGAWRERDHDDLVLATALAAWAGEQALPYEGPVGVPRVLMR